MTFGNWLWPLRRRQLFSAASASLKIMASAVLLERHPLERTVRWRAVANELSMGFVEFRHGIRALTQFWCIRGLVGTEESGLKEIELSTTVHLAFHELELCDLPLY